MLQSQLDTLEPPAPDEDALALDIDMPADQQTRLALAWLNRTP